MVRSLYLCSAAGACSSQGRARQSLIFQIRTGYTPVDL